MKFVFEYRDYFCKVRLSVLSLCIMYVGLCTLGYMFYVLYGRVVFYFRVGYYVGRI